MRAQTARANIGRYLAHLAIAWPGIMIAVFGGAIISTGVMVNAIDKLVEPPVFPLQLAVALLLGYWLNRSRRSQVPCWVWVPPLLFFAWDVYGFLSSRAYVWDRIGPWEDVWQTYFGTGCLECLANLIVTGPLYTALLYSLGAWIALRWPQWSFVSGRSGSISRTLG